jgi:hypothetical protein
VLGEHLIRYTDEVVLPRIDRTLASLGPEVTRALAPSASPEPAPAGDLAAAMGG